MLDNDKIKCVILAGGQGSRLDGKGKYSQILCNKTLLEHVLYRLSSQTDNIAINFRDSKFSFYKDYSLVLDKFKENIGPLAGIHAALSDSIKNKKIGAQLVVTVPVDTPFLPLDLIAKFKDKIKSSLADVVVACSGNRHHPTIAIWRVSVIKKLELCIKNKVRKIDMFTKELEKAYLNWDIRNYDPFFNVNDLKDLNYAESIIRKNIIS